MHNKRAKRRIATNQVFVSILLCTDTGTASNATRSNEIAGNTDAATKCRDPNGLEGVCRNIKQCPIILKNFVRLVSERDESYIYYIRKSNAICTTTNEPIICCPTKRKSNTGAFNSRKIDIPTITGRLLTPEEGCGLGKPITRPRTINPGFPTKSGNLINGKMN